MNVLDQKHIEQLNDMQAFISFQQTWLFKKFIYSPEKILALFTGNQYGKTAGVVYQYVMRLLGIHPIPEKNILYFKCESRACKKGHRYKSPPKDMICQECGYQLSKFSGHKFTFKTIPKSGVCPECDTKVSMHQRESRIIRLASNTLPHEKRTTTEGGNESAEIKNTVYPALKKWLPHSLIKHDITERNPSITCHDPHGIGDVIFEFISYNQASARDQGGAGVQRVSIMEDEEAPEDFHKEQIPRLVAENGDLIISLTPANKITWTFDEIFERASIYYRTQAIVDFLKEDDEEVERIDRTDSNLSIAVFQAAMDDNPTLDKQTIESMMDLYYDPDVKATRRYGVFRQSSGRIFNFDYKTHFISREKYFPDDMYHDWVHARMVDYHEHVPWGIVWIAVSPTNEAFIYEEFNPSPEKIQTLQITREMARKSKDYRYLVNLIDPLGTKTQSNTGESVLDDFNRHFREYRKEAICEGGYWESWDTRSTKGRDAIRERLKNAKLCGTPFNNTTQKDGLKHHLPTLWVLNNCRETARSLKNWRKNEKGEPEQKNSHFCTAIEAIFKDRRFKPKRAVYQQNAGSKGRKHFQGVC